MIMWWFCKKTVERILIANKVITERELKWVIKPEQITRNIINAFDSETTKKRAV
ncbi:hypothetical protein KIN20_003961 [Parelaphostrongylus tenuis]|uniref:Uncharacterized protein n=1 Tax=Parelaphostrongylus tenuis TaxID=148309 RepID=A0AAD5MJ21_PARTN|nr:hypothetical protein KIN20_003961 [Parelaphostrongylus tenuis]